jgi:hypothetical protein
LLNLGYLPGTNARAGLVAWSGPAYLPAMPIAAVTRLRLRKLRFVPALMVHAFRSRRQARASEGCLAVNMRMQGACVFWTRTLWRDAKALRDFMRSGGTHGAVMPRLQHWCDEAAVVDWEKDSLPDWGEAEAQMLSAGRVSRVRHPSPARARGETVPGG